VTKAALLATACLGISASAALALDWTLKSQLAQSLELNDNYQLQPKSPGETYAPVSKLLFDVLARTPTMRFAATADLSYRTYFGPGAENLLAGLDRGARASVEKTDKLATYNLGGSWQLRSAAEEQRADTGIGTVAGDTIRTTVEGGLKRQLSLIDSLTWSARATSLEFTGSGGTPSLDVTTRGTWTRRLTPTTDLTPSLEFEHIAYENRSDSEVTIWRAMAEVKSQLSRRLTFKGAAGAALVTLSQNGNGAPPPDPSDPANPAGFLGAASGTVADWLADVRLTYLLNPTTEVALAAAQTVGPDVLAAISKRDTVGLTVNRKLDPVSNLVFSGDFSHVISGGGTSDLYSAAVTYGREFAREWHASLSYRFRQRNAAGTSAQSNSVSVLVKRDVTVLP
jgi:hypothetical protein